MRHAIVKFVVSAILGMSVIPMAHVYAQDITAATPQVPPQDSADTRSDVEVQSSADADSDAEADRDRDDRRRHERWRRHSKGNEIVSVGHDSVLKEGQSADAVISIRGSSTSAGTVRDAVVSILGSTHVTGPVGDSAVAVLGSTYVNSKVGRDVVAVLGSVELGPQAEVGGNVVSVGGHIYRDPQAIVHGQVNNVGFGARPAPSEEMKAWFDQCLRYGRLLAIDSRLGWAWGVALGFLVFYILIALLFRSGVERCVQTFETQPGRSAVAAIAATLLTPVLFFLLIITLIGIAAVPLLVVGLFGVSLFGKTIMLAWLGRRVTRLSRNEALSHVAIAVLIGGIIALGLYMIPVFGFLIYKLLGWLGFGAVVYTAVLAYQRHSAVQPTPAPAAPHADIPAAPSATEIPPAETLKPTATQVPESTLPRAGFWIRMGALAIDTVLIGIILSAVHRAGPLTTIALAIYGAVMWKLRGTTIGGIVCNLKVVRTDGRELDWATAIVRALGCLLSLAVAGLGFLWIAFDAEKQAWHDKIAGTAVVRVSKGVSLV